MQAARIAREHQAEAFLRGIFWSLPAVESRIAAEEAIKAEEAASAWDRCPSSRLKDAETRKRPSLGPVAWHAHFRSKMRPSNHAEQVSMFIHSVRGPADLS